MLVVSLTGDVVQVKQEVAVDTNLLRKHMPGAGDPLQFAGIQIDALEGHRAIFQEGCIYFLVDLIDVDLCSPPTCIGKLNLQLQLGCKFTP